jgi:hypothetical protein
MPKTTTIDHTGVLEMALVGYELQRNRIEAAIAEIQAELGEGGPSRSIATATDHSEPKTTGKRRFSAAARKRMALAQKKRWQLLKAKNAEAAKPKRKPAAKRRKASVTASRKQRPAEVKAAKKTTPKTRKAAPRIQKAVAKPKVQELVTPVQAAVEPAPTEATA